MQYKGRNEAGPFPRNSLGTQSFSPSVVFNVPSNISHLSIPLEHFMNFENNMSMESDPPASSLFAIDREKSIKDPSESAQSTEKDVLHEVLTHRLQIRIYLIKY